MRTAGYQAGIGMIEVLVSLLVLSIGVLGFAALQVRASQAGGESYFRGQAVAIAQDLAERMRVNPGQETDVYLKANHAAWTDTLPTVSASESNPTTWTSACVAADCTAENMAAADVRNIRFTADRALPRGRVAIGTCPGSVLNCVYVAWNGTEPTAGVSGDCVNSAGQYVSRDRNGDGSTNSADDPSCVMVEVL